MEYHGGARGAPPVVLVGKGITFDTGGISIKPALELDEMKFDMCGAASVFGAIARGRAHEAAAQRRRHHPGDGEHAGRQRDEAGRHRDHHVGQTVEILDTDHEGRLVLCDALTYAERYEPAAVIDIATLTDRS
jgi:leucyl aminopeptidase